MNIGGKSLSKKDKTVVNQPIILNTLKEKSSYICPNCGEKYCTYVFKKRKQKVIDISYYFEIGFFRESYYYEWHHCLTCGHEWEIRKYTEN